MPAKKWRYCLHVIQKAVPGSQKQFRYGLWCPWLHRRESSFLSFRVSSGIGIKSTFRHSFRASLTAMTRVDSAERVDKLNKDFNFNTLPTMIHEVLRKRSLYGPLHHQNDSPPGSACKFANHIRAQCTNARLHQYLSTRSLDQVIECVVSVTRAWRHHPMLLSLQFFLLFLCWALNK